jgi:hypothetical protein
MGRAEVVGTRQERLVFAPEIGKLCLGDVLLTRNVQYLSEEESPKRSHPGGYTRALTSCPALYRSAKVASSSVKPRMRPVIFERTWMGWPVGRRG